VALLGLSIATSGDYRRYFEHDGRRYAHTIDPRTGYPAAHALASVTVLHRECMMADALSTALTVLGPAGITFATRQGLAARFLVRTPHGFDERVTRRSPRCKHDASSTVGNACRRRGAVRARARS
jgi:thiamine biosynthesis lipoprotein